MERKYSIYKITSPSGKSYIGLTGSKITERWRQHVKKAATGYNHPFYCAIRKYGAASFILEELVRDLTKGEAQTQEKIYIANTVLKYNISVGGECDGDIGGSVFWGRINADPEARESYLQKLSDAKIANDWSDYDSMSAKAKTWRIDNAKTAYKLSRRALRMIKQEPKAVDTRTLKERLMWKHNLSMATRISVTKVWSKRSPEQRAEVGRNISNARKAKLEELRKDPVAYKAFMDKMWDTRRKNKSV